MIATCSWVSFCTFYGIHFLHGRNVSLENGKCSREKDHLPKLYIRKHFIEWWQTWCFRGVQVSRLTLGSLELLQGEVPSASARTVCWPMLASTAHQKPHAAVIQGSAIGSRAVWKGRRRISSVYQWLLIVLGCDRILRAARESIIIIDLTEALIQLYEQERGNSRCLPRSSVRTRDLKGNIQLEVSLHKGKFYLEWEMKCENSLGAGFSLGDAQWRVCFSSQAPNGKITSSLNLKWFLPIHNNLHLQGIGKLSPTTSLSCSKLLSTLKHGKTGLQNDIC